MYCLGQKCDVDHTPGLEFAIPRSTVWLIRAATGNWLQYPRRAVTAVLLALGITGCDSPFEVADPAPLDPLPQYSEWWVELESCVGREGDFADIRWYEGESIVVQHREAYGVWLAPDVIVMKRFYVTSQSAVKHEMLHYLTLGEMPHDHPAFDRCTVPAQSDSLTTWTVDPALGRQ